MSGASDEEISQIDIFLMSVNDSQRFLILRSQDNQKRVLELSLTIRQSSALCHSMFEFEASQLSSEFISAVLIEKTGSTLISCILYDRDDDICLARLRIQLPGKEELIIECVPVEGITIARRLKCPVYVAWHLFKQIPPEIEKLISGIQEPRPERSLH